MATMGKAFVTLVCDGLPEDTEPMVRELAENVVFMHKKLSATRKALRKEAVVVPYDNGGGQTGIRRNPAFEMYCTLLAQYRRSIDQIIGILQKHGREEETGESTPLADILAAAEREFSDE